jgi:serine/threonine-protein kinase HipA
VADPVDVAEVHLWGRQIGAVAWDDQQKLGFFEYSPDFVGGPLDVAPFTMPPGSGIYSFPELARDTYHGLPGLLADSLPDRFGNVLIDAWLTRQGRDRSSFSPVEQLCYVGTRGMGALEYQPAMRGNRRSDRVSVDALADLAAEILEGREALETHLDDPGLHELLQVGTSAGGARAKAIITWNPDTGEIRSGQVAAPDGFEYWLLKFDGVGGAETDLSQPRGFGRIEYAYNLMAVDAGIVVTESRLEVDTTGRAHFMTRRFDRTEGGEKIHMQSLSALRHFDFNQPGRHSYEDALTTAQGLGGAGAEVEQLYRRMVFNVVARNQDDHTKNIAFLMDPSGRWRLAPAYDVIWAYNPAGRWTPRHQMAANGKTDDFARSDLTAVGRRFGIRDPGGIVDDVASIVGQWPQYADKAEVDAGRRRQIAATHRLDLAK